MYRFTSKRERVFSFKGLLNIRVAFAFAVAGNVIVFGNLHQERERGVISLKGQVGLSALLVRRSRQ